MVKTLIYFKEDRLMPVGGPSGYLYNLKIEVDNNNDDDIRFINYENESKSIMNSFSSKIVRFYNRVKYDNSQLRYLKYMMWKSKHKGCIDLNLYDVVHFHSTLDMFSERVNLQNYNGIVVLTSHSPKIFHREIIEDYISGNEYKKNQVFYDSLKEVDEYAFNRADVVVFPCEGAEEPYYSSWNRYASIRKNLNIKYLPTGIIKQTFNKSREEVRKNYSIPEDAFVVSFVGRHSEVKGYDRLVELFDKLENVYFICCGKESKINHPNNKRWIEVGWTDDPYSYVNASDLFILPNRETYFDLSLLQTISIGKNVAISNTGGNKFFSGHEKEGIYLFDNLEDVEKIIDLLKMHGNNKVPNPKLIDYFNSNYTSSIFYNNYKRTIQNIFEEKHNK